MPRWWWLRPAETIPDRLETSHSFLLSSRLHFLGHWNTGESMVSLLKKMLARIAEQNRGLCMLYDRNVFLRFGFTLSLAPTPSGPDRTTKIASRLEHAQSLAAVKWASAPNKSQKKLISDKQIDFSHILLAVGIWRILVPNTRHGSGGYTPQSKGHFPIIGKETAPWQIARKYPPIEAH